MGLVFLHMFFVIIVIHLESGTEAIDNTRTKMNLHHKNELAILGLHRKPNIAATPVCWLLRAEIAIA